MITSPSLGRCHLKSGDHIPIAALRLVVELSNRIPRRQALDTLLLGYDALVARYDERSGVRGHGTPKATSNILNDVCATTSAPVEAFPRRLRKLGYTVQKGKAGSARSFRNPGRIPNVVSFREPLPGQDMRQRMLHEYLRKLVSPYEFIQLLEDC
jgi:hypothetical protein